MHRDAPAVKARESRCSHRASLKKYALNGYMARPKQILRRGQKEELLFCPEGVHKVHMTHATKPSGVLLLLGTHVLIKYACCYSYAVVHTP